MDLGLAHLRLTSQMRCSHLTALFKFSAKNIALFRLGQFNIRTLRFYARECLSQGIFAVVIAWILIRLGTFYRRASLKYCPFGQFHGRVHFKCEQTVNIVFFLFFLPLYIEKLCVLCYNYGCGAWGRVLTRLLNADGGFFARFPFKMVFKKAHPFRATDSD